MSVGNEVGPERARLNFAHGVMEAFSFLVDRGYTVIESLPTLVRYRKGDIEACIYHGRRSYEVGFEIIRNNERYSISELIRVADIEESKRYRNHTATNPEVINDALRRLRALVSLYGEPALRGDPDFFVTLEKLRRKWLENYSMDVRARHLRPKAEAAFRNGNYREAAALYEKIRPLLSEVEMRKLALAKQRTGS